MTSDENKHPDEEKKMSEKSCEEETNIAMMIEVRYDYDTVCLFLVWSPELSFPPLVNRSRSRILDNTRAAIVDISEIVITVTFNKLTVKYLNFEGDYVVYARDNGVVGSTHPFVGSRGSAAASDTRTVFESAHPYSHRAATSMTKSSRD